MYCPHVNIIISFVFRYIWLPGTGSVYCIPVFVYGYTSVVHIWEQSPTSICRHSCVWTGLLSTIVYLKTRAAPWTLIVFVAETFVKKDEVGCRLILSNFLWQMEHFFTTLLDLVAGVHLATSRGGHSCLRECSFLCLKIQAMFSTSVRKKILLNFFFWNLPFIKLLENHPKIFNGFDH